MNKDITNKRLLVFSIALYLILLFTEIYINLFSYIANYSKGKLGVTFFSTVREILDQLKFDIAAYILSLLIIYLIFALVNYKFVMSLAQAISKSKPNNSIPIKGVLFICVNVFFILILYFLNYAFYPNSNITDFANFLLKQEHYRTHHILAVVLMTLYLLALLVVFLKYASKKSKILTLGFFAVIFVSILHPSYHLNSIFSLFRNSMNSGPNVIIIGLDSLNPHHTGYFGYAYDTTPNLDKFLEENIVFKDCYTPLARTTPSWFSILSGQYPPTHGVRYNLMKRKFHNPRSETITNYLNKHREYFTVHLTDETRFCNLQEEDGFEFMKHPLTGIKDFLLGDFHDYSLPNIFFNNPLGFRIFDFLNINRAVYHLYKHNYFSNDVASIVSTLVTKEKFFLAVHYCAPHWPYEAPNPYPNLFMDEKNYKFASYDGTLRMADEQFGHLLETLKKRRLYENSIIIVLSDHGETLHGHGTNLKDSEQNHILLAMKLPQGKKHLEIEELVRSIDIAPTILAVLGERAESMDMDGVSLLPLIKGPTAGGSNKTVILETGFSVDVPGGIGLAFQDMISEGISFYEFDKKGFITVKEELHRELINRKQRAIQTSEWKLVVEPQIRMDQSGKTITLYSLIEDPECTTDVSDVYPKIYAQLLEELTSYYQEELNIK